MTAFHGDRQDWSAVAKALIDGVFDARDREGAVDHVLTTLEPVRCRADVMALAAEMEPLRGRSSGDEYKMACSAMGMCLSQNMVPVQPPLTSAAVAVVTLLAIGGSVVAGRPAIALALTPVLAGCLLMIGRFVVCLRRADPTDAARLPDRRQLLALRSVRLLPQRRESAAEEPA